MCKKIFIAATGQHCGKTTISLSLLHLAKKKYARVGFIKPIGPKVFMLDGVEMDMDAALIAGIYGMEADRKLMSPVVVGKGYTKRYLSGEIAPDAPLEAIKQACAELEAKNDFLIIEGSGHGGVGSVVGINNAQIARTLDAPVIMVASGGIGCVIDSVQLNLSLFQQQGAEVKLVLVNKLLANKREETLGYLRTFFESRQQNVAGAFDYSPTLANPTLLDLSKLLKLPLQGDQEGKNRIINHIQLGAASSQRVIDTLQDSTLLITTSSRDELIVTASALYNIPAYRRKLAGVVIPGSAPVSAITQRILDDSNIPYLRTSQNTAETFITLTEHVSKITADDNEKIDLIKSTAESVFDFDVIDAMSR
ncbi:AAA family ATPase [Geomonas nitrogeniifigens]|uniref:AAA family ATPase n=1 Tax=Geomonas diazotrophica TaxID=2843197 RepID=A0ABX8JDX4_9BACT|nr:AAA family ATPase [Geomonas nitrogeniifigens]QWV96608.1 AAA family ATPase [Geomonas nitrogeniifigens]QXE85710.1 AAA family ATPase [Geomonas nitrogeniifigens]